MSAPTSPKASAAITPRDPKKTDFATPSPAASTAPARLSSTSAATNSSKRSSSRNKDKDAPKAKADAPEKKGGHERKGSARSGGRRGSQGAATAPKRDGAATPPAQSGPSEGLDNLKNIIASLKDGSPAAAASPSSSPSRARNNPAQHHRKTASGSTTSTPTIVAPPTSSAPAGLSTLNPKAGGFHPNTLGPISDMMDEGLITPTASGFDLMTGRPVPGGGVGGFRGQGFTDFSTLGAGELPEEIPGFGGVAGLNSRAFAFPQTPQSLTQQQQFLQLQQQQQQQQFQLQQLAAMGYGADAAAPRFQQSSSGGSSATELMAEQMAIQQQLENLRIQQENLLVRFGEMSVGGAPASTTSSPVQPSPTQGHRRIQSQQVGGMMGSFGQGGMGNFGAQSAPSLPKGHGRRHSVNVVKSTPPGHSSSSSLSGMNVFAGNGGAAPAAGFGLGPGFQFPNNGAQQGQQENEFGPPPTRNFGHTRNTSGSMSSMSGGWSMNNNPHHGNGQANLAEAQSHLQQLGAYRASAGHARTPSFGMSGLGGGPGQLAMAGYGGGITTQGPGQQMRKSLFAPYLPQASIPPLLAAGKLVIGVLRVNKRNRSDAYVATDVLDADIYICGSKDRNRALEGDVVAIELLDVDEVWGTKKEKEEKKRKKEESASYDPRATRDSRKQDKKKDDVEVEGQGLMLFEEEEVNDDQKPQFAGHVVAVVERAPGQLFSGMLGVLRPSSAATQQKQDAERREREGVDLRGNHAPQQAPRIIWFRPTDKRVPLIAIPTEQAPHDFIDRPDMYADRLFVACIKRWPITSLHPFGTLVEELGPIGDIETETNALLKDCNFTAEDFSESVVKCLPPTPWEIPEHETSNEVRRDFRKHRVFTIDPETAKDLDDALHVVKNEDGTFEVGVHIADVTHFVKPNTALDREARKRATTVYLVQRAVPMLPQTLSEELCSLNPGQDKLTFSVVFTMTAEGRIVSTWFGKTIINSAVKLAYSDAQAVIDGGSIPDAKIGEGQHRDDVEADILSLASIARQLRARRFENGALTIDNVKVTFGLDAEGFPDDCGTFIRKEANELIEEFMLLANISVAGKIAAGLPDQALLRRHEPPIDRRLDAFIDRMKRLDISLDGSSAGALMKSVNLITDPNSRITLQHLSTKSMQRAKYFCTGMLDIAKYQHYALNLPLYTHFTSPIRRYADIMVHRQLEAVLLGAGDARFSLDAEAVSKVAQTCNVKKDAARLAQEQSAHLFLCILISDLTQRYGPVVRPATVIGVLDEAFDVLVTEFGIEKRVHVDQMPTENHVHDEHTNSLQLYWKQGVDVLRWLAENQNDAHLQRVRHQADHHARLMESTSGSAQAESALFDDDEVEDGSFVKVVGPDKSAQHAKSQDRTAPVFEEVETTAAGHHVQTIRELQTVPVLITADMSKSPPVIKVVSLNPFV